jgi:hypothetical protein
VSKAVDACVFLALLTIRFLVSDEEERLGLLLPANTSILPPLYNFNRKFRYI